jgi:uncharacterized protein (TIGR03435 family)
MNNFTRSLLSALVLSALALSASLASAQTPGPAFEVASVKPNKSGEQGSRVGMAPNGRFTATNVTLKQLITNAYNLRSFQVTGGPDWLDVDRFDISATVGHAIQPTAGGPPPELIQMFKNFLADRFKLVARTETKEGPIYQLVLARPDGKLGAKLRAAEVDCAALMARGGPPPTTAPGEMPPCGTRITNGRLNGRGGAMPQIVRTLAGLPGVERLIVDKTGLIGSFDLDLEWTQDPSIDVSGPSLFTALQEQLGLKLEPARGPTEVLVIDGAQLPSPD